MNASALSNLDLRDIHATATPELWPPAPGWWLLAVLLTALLVLASQQLLKRWRRRQRQARILKELDALSNRSPTEIVTGVSTLLRRVALMRYQRSKVASLSGDAWLAFLDATGGSGAFSQGAGNLLATAPYAAHATTSASSDALLTLARQWIKQQGGKHFVEGKHVC